MRLHKQVFLTIFIVLLGLTTNVNAKTQQFTIIFKGISAGQATLSLPDVLAFPVLGTNVIKPYKISLALKPNSIANFVGADKLESESEGVMTAEKVFPKTYKQIESGQLVIEGKFDAEEIRVINHKKNKLKKYNVPVLQVNDPLSLILQLQQDLRRQTHKSVYAIVDDKRLNRFTVDKFTVAKERYKVKLSSQDDKSIFEFEFDIALDLKSLTKRHGDKLLYSLQAK